MFGTKSAKKFRARAKGHEGRPNKDLLVLVLPVWEGMELSDELSHDGPPERAAGGGLAAENGIGGLAGRLSGQSAGKANWWSCLAT